MPTGIVDDLTAYASDTCHIERFVPAIRAFYENTAAQTLLIHPEWHRRFRVPSRLYKVFSRRLGQMNLPLLPDTANSHIKSTIIPLLDKLDGRENVRGWIRVYEATQEAVYVAAYATHFCDGIAYMNIAFPLPLGNLTSVLHLTTFELDDSTCLRLSSSSGNHPNGRQGVYFSTKWFTIRVPFNEIIEIFSMPYETMPAVMNNGRHEVFARHRVWLFGFHFLTLHYGIHETPNH